jgi:hypothetical protein
MPHSTGGIAQLMLNEIQTTTLRNRDMPIKTPTTKAGKREAMRSELHEFKAGKLHSGSKHGPVVTNPKQAVAIALHVSGQSKPSGVKTPKPDHPRNPGPYQDDAHDRSYRAVEKDDKPSTGSVGGVVEHAEIDGDIHRGRQSHSFDRPSARGSHGYGHGASQRVGALRMSGARGAHRIGK